MLTLNSKKLLNIIRYAPVLIVSFFAIAVNLVVIHDSQDTADHSVKNLRTELLNHQRSVIREQVYFVSKQMRIEKSLLEREITAQSKKRVYEAYSIAYNIYVHNQNKSKSEVTQLIAEALRPIQFFNGRGYFFIYDNNGVGVMHGLNPHIEGKESLNLQDNHNAYVVRELLQIVEQRNEGGHRWWFQKPGKPAGEEYEKVGFVKKFEPYQWMIGTGEYLSDAEEDIKQQMLKWLTNYEYGEGGYFFVLNKQGTLLAHHYNDFLGSELSVGHPIDEALLKHILAQTRHGGGYFRYQKPLTMSGNVSLEQIGYVKQVKDWDWIIGTGFYTKSFENYLAEKEQELAAYNQREIIRLIFLGIISTLLLMVVSFYVGNLIAKRFALYHQRVESDFNRLENTKNKMEYMALHDALTGLPNRTLLITEIRKRLSYAKKTRSYLAIMFVDLDNFKTVNDLYGHAIGDKLLAAISHKFTTLLTKEDYVARFGGDEFVFCFSNLSNIADARGKAALPGFALQEPFIIDGKILTIGCSVGVSVYPVDSNDAEGLIRNADIALYKSKIHYKGDVFFYDSSISEQIKYDRMVENELKRAVGNGEITVNYQPQVDTKNGKILGVEALARWKSPQLGMVSPTTFIDIAEKTGKIQEIGLYVFKQACNDIYKLSPNGTDALRVSVNVSPKQIVEPGLAKQFVDICREVGIDIHRVTIEITENVLIHRIDEVEPILNHIRKLGFGISLDDFGTGYSSLSYINNLPLTEIKIDRSFVEKMSDNPRSEMLVKIIVGIGQSCGMTVVAEGVEIQSQLEQLVHYECDLAQGYYFDRPLTIEQLTQRFVDYHGKYIPDAQTNI